MWLVPPVKYWLYRGLVAQMLSVSPVLMVLATGCTFVAGIHCGILAVLATVGTEVTGVHGGMLAVQMTGCAVAGGKS